MVRQQGETRKASLRVKTTKIDEIEDLADGVPVLIVEGTVKYASEVKQGTTGKTDWSRQFFVLTSGTAEVGCTLWDAEGNAMKKGESVRIENTQDKKGHWTGITKGSYSKEGKLNHTLEIRAEKVKITNPDVRDPRATMQQGEAQDYGDVLSERANAPQSPPARPYAETVGCATPRDQQGEDGVTATRKHLMQSANLYNLCVAAVDKAIAPNMPPVAQTSEMFQAAVASLYIEASKDVWWSGKIVRESWLSSMPTTPLVPNGKKHVPAPVSKEEEKEYPF